jgi:hypothetical protein
VAQKFEDRRASIYRVRARELTEAAAHEPRDDVHRHMLDQAASFKRIRWRPNQTNNWRGITSPILPKNVDRAAWMNPTSQPSTICERCT